MLAGPHHSATPYLVTVPWTHRNFSWMWLRGLPEGLKIDGEMATAYTQEVEGLRAQPVFAS